LDQCTTSDDEAILTPAAMDLLADALATPLQMDQYLTLALEAGYRAGQKPVTPEVIASVLARGLDDIEPTLARHGYTAKTLADVLHMPSAEMRAFLRGRLPPGRAQELQSELRAVGLPL
jgi:hypothetical protein